jgi:hypothetical protein
MPRIIESEWNVWDEYSIQELDSTCLTDDEVVRQISSVPTHYTGPQIVQWAIMPVVLNPTGSTNKIFWHPPNPTLSNNCLVMALSWDNTVLSSFTITDDQSNTWAPTGSLFTTTNGQLVGIWNVPGAAAGVTKFTFTANTSSTDYFLRAVFVEVSGVDTSTPVDGHTYSSNANNSTSHSQSLATTVDGDMILSFDISDQSGNPIRTTSFTAGTNFTLLGAALSYAIAAEYWVQPTHNASTTVGFTSGTGIGSGQLSIALKASAGAGTPRPSTKWIFGRQAESLGAAAGPYNLQFPCIGNLLYTFHHTASPSTIYQSNCVKSITDSNSNTWVVSHNPNTSNVSSMSESSSTVTVNTSTNHGLSISSGNGDVVNISGCSVSGYNGNWLVKTVPSNTQFTFLCSTTGLGAASDGVVAQAGQYDGDGGGAADAIQSFYAPNATTSLGMTLTINLIANPTATGATVMHFDDILGMDPNPFDGFAVANGNQSAGGNQNVGTITPNSSSGIAYQAGLVWLGTEEDLVGANFQSDIEYPGATNGLDTDGDTNDGQGHYYYSNNSPITFTWTTNGTALQFWSSVMIAFKAQSSSPITFVTSTIKAGSRPTRVGTGSIVHIKTG